MAIKIPCPACGSKQCRLDKATNLVTCKNGHEFKIDLGPSPHQPITDFVCYVVTVVSVKCSTTTADEAKDFAVAEVQRLFEGLDNRVYIPRVAVTVAGDDDEQKKNIDLGDAPWMNE